MLRKSLAALALVGLFALPAHGQEAAYQWNAERPDARPPAGILGGRMIPQGEFHVQYTLGKMNYEEVRLGSEIISFFDVLDLYDAAPLERTEMRHQAVASWGFLDWVTFEASVAWLDYSRDLATEDVLVMNDATGISDITAGALIRLYEKDGVVAHLNGAVEIPTGSTEKVGPGLDGTTRLLPYDMQMGSGSISIVPGATAAIQNEYGTVGAQVLARFRMYDNDRDYRLGDDFRGNLWMAIPAGDHVAINTGIRVHRWGSIEGSDPAMDPALEPGQDPFFSAGTRVVIPAGLNLRIPEGLLAGTDVLFEFVFPTYESFDAPRLDGDWGFNFTLSRGLGIY